MIAIGDNSMLLGERLPATAQVREGGGNERGGSGMGAGCCAVQNQITVSWWQSCAQPTRATTRACVLLQVAGQQGAWVARLLNRGFVAGQGGMDQAPPVKVSRKAADRVSPRRDNQSVIMLWLWP
jgi:hypothetical protein